MKSALLWSSLCLLLPLAATSQSAHSLFMPLNIQRAYEAGTRSLDGRPGPNYFQNEASYDMQVRIEPETETLSGQARIVYKNNSPRTLRKLVLRLYQDMYKRGSERDQYISPEDEHDGVQLAYLRVGGDSLSLESSLVSRSGTNMTIALPDALPPAAELTLDIGWQFPIPTQTLVRMGKYGDQSYFIAYWYPQVAVYDDVDGWDEANHGGLHEFYQDFADFQVEITAPAEFVVWGTGELQNGNDLLAPRVWQQYQLAQRVDTVVHLMTAADYRAGRRATREGEWHSWKFEASNVPDFAFALADHYLWDASSVIVDSTTKRRVLVDACYKPNSPDFPEVAGIARKVVADLSFNLPGIPFPYPKITVFNGEDLGGGMEYPMMVNNASSFSTMFSVYLTYHEIAHTYFPFYMGTNERKYAWMDEGWASILPTKLSEELVPSGDPLGMQIFRYLSFAGDEMERPLMTPSIQLDGRAYGTAAYSKPALAYHYLRDMLGETRFKQALLTYMERWHGKHPLPYDFFYSMNEGSGQNLNWYWNDWFFWQGYPDLALEDVAIKGKKAKLRVTRPGGLPLPIHLTFLLKDGTEQQAHYTALAWKDGTEAVELKFRFKEAIEQIKLGGADIPDVHPSDNLYDLND